MTTETRPIRKRATSPTAATVATKAAKAAAVPVVATPKVAPAVAETVTNDGMSKFVVECEKQPDTKSYAKFTPPASSGCVGTIYAPLGTETVKVLLIGPAA